MTASTIRRKPNYDEVGASARARFITDSDGRFFFRTILPCSYPIPTDGPVGEMIVQTKRHPMRPAHVHFLVNAKGYEPLITHVFMDGDKYLDSDVVFGVKDDLVAKVEPRNDPAMPDGSQGERAVAPDDLRIPPQARRRHRAEADGDEGGGAGLTRDRPCLPRAEKGEQGHDGAGQHHRGQFPEQQRIALDQRRGPRAEIGRIGVPSSKMNSDRSSWRL